MKTNPQVGFHERALRAKESCRLRAALETKVLLKPGPNPGFQEGISPVATGDSGRCPENPQTFEKV
ncbi:hypothetical protein [Butyricicoccus pullicaecorum]|uniref:hypothetical protein n=1 Tax=Butyricicoccus pullicaecorum TaxID=501571 RepID=UPI001177AE54|nr:hypothetical protein [Butyricicoccus pullicaecorum]